MTGLAIVQLYVSPTGGAGAAESRPGDPVRRRAKAHPLSPLEAPDPDALPAGSGDFRAQRPQEALQGHDFRLPGCAEDQRLSLRAAGGQHGVLRGAYAGKGQADHRSLQPCRQTVQRLSLLPDLRPQKAQGQQVQINGALAKHAASRKAQLRPPAAGQEGAHENHRGAHPAHQLPGDGTAVDPGGVYAHPLPFPADRTAQVLQDLKRRVHIPQAGYTVQLHRAGAEQTGRQDRKHRVLGALNPALSHQALPALDAPQIHKNPPCAQNQAILCTEGGKSEK